MYWKARRSNKLREQLCLKLDVYRMIEWAQFCHDIAMYMDSMKNGGYMCLGGFFSGHLYNKHGIGDGRGCGIERQCDLCGFVAKSLTKFKVGLSIDH